MNETISLSESRDYEDLFRNEYFDDIEQLNSKLNEMIKCIKRSIDSTSVNEFGNQVEKIEDLTVELKNILQLTETTIEDLRCTLKNNRISEVEEYSSEDDEESCYQVDESDKFEKEICYYKKFKNLVKKEVQSLIEFKQTSLENEKKKLNEIKSRYSL